MTKLIRTFLEKLSSPQPLFFILVSGFFLRIALSAFGTLSLDQNTFVAWSNILVERGFSKFYEGWSDYLPGYLYILWFLGKVKESFPIPGVLLYKLPAILADTLIGYLIYKIVEKIKGKKWGLVTSSLYLFNPAILANSTFWGQVDSLTSLFALAAVYFLSSNFILSSIFLALGTLIKPQAAFIFPLLLVIMLRDKWKVGKISTYLILGLLVFIVGFYPFSNGGNLLLFVYERILVTLEQYPYTSVNAFNFWGLSGFWESDKAVNGIIGPQAVGYASILLLLVPVFLKVVKGKTSKYLTTSLVFAVTFLFATRMHERHLLPILAPLAIATSLNPGLIIVYIGFSLTYIANLYYSYVWISKDFLTIFSPVVTTFISFVNLVLLGVMFIAFFRKNLLERLVKFFKPGIIERAGGRLITFPEEKLGKNWTKGILFAILAFSLVSRLAWLHQPPNEYFDEVYHAFTAKLVLRGDPKAWEWWNPHPEGFAYEWTHPPLAKLGMALGMLIFGENSFGYRIPGALLGVGSVFLIYLITKKLFGGIKPLNIDSNLIPIGPEYKRI